VSLFFFPAFSCNFVFSARLPANRNLLFPVVVTPTPPVLYPPSSCMKFVHFFRHHQLLLKLSVRCSGLAFDPGLLWFGILCTPCVRLLYAANKRNPYCSLLLRGGRDSRSTSSPGVRTRGSTLAYQVMPSLKVSRSPKPALRTFVTTFAL
jgi:hypothetical protein